MQNSLQSAQTAFVTCRQLPAVDWQPGAACTFTDPLAVFRFALPPSAAVAMWFERLLTTAERVRANRYHRPADRLRFVCGRGLLRTVSGNYTQQPPDRMYITVGLNNKPELDNAPGLCVNLAHAGNWVVLAVGSQSVGVDVEIMDDDFDYQAIMASIFSAAEQQEISQTAQPGQLFYDYWTRKEALLKATGLGITDDLCHVPARNGHHPVSSQFIGGAGAWLVQSFVVDNVHPAALAHQPGATEPVFYSLNLNNLF
jgi:4'-phosphopantetheinyl transferase